MSSYVNLIFRHFLMFAVLLVITAPGFSQPLPECYHRLDEVYDFIFQLQAQHPDIVRVDSIGHSRGDQLGHQYPIYAVKISDSVNTFEDEPVLLIVCHIHAEEVIGIELSVDYMSRLASGQYNTLLNNTQIYFIPTMNPDGLQVISYGVPSGNDTLWDNKWRKNGYVPPELGGSCNVFPGSGGELCGVDLNRNFELNWIFGDTLWRPASSEVYDYYRGPSPFSEPECRAVRDFAMQIKPALSIVYHSSRSGRVAEQGIVAWAWGADPGPYKYAPDSASISRVNDSYCNLLPKYSDVGTYTRVWGNTHNGCLQDWFYWRLGCTQVLTELGPGVDIQPACTTLTELVVTDRASLNWMHRRLLNLGSDMSNEPAVLRVYTRDPAGNPLSAEWRNLNTWTPGLAPWYTNEQFGRATFFPPLGPVAIMAQKEGYRPDTVTVVINPSGMANASLTLEPLPWHVATFHIRDGAGSAVQGNIHLEYDYPKWVAVPTGGQMVNLVEGNYRAMVVPDDPNLLVTWRDFYVGGDTEVDVWCPVASVLWSENFQSLDAWTSGGGGNNWRLEADTTMPIFGQSLYTNPSTGSSWPYVYPNDANAWIEYNNPMDLTGSINVAVLRFDRRGRMEIPADSVFVEISTDNQTWHKAAGFCDMDVPWTRTYVNLAPWAGSNVHLRFRLITDYAVGELGMFIDNLQVLTGLDTSAPIPPEGIPYSYRIVSAFPNPFNPSTSIKYETAAAGLVEWSIYNITGQIVRREEITVAAAGSHTFVWNGANSGGYSVPTGLYFARMKAGGHVATRKLLLLR